MSCSAKQMTKCKYHHMNIVSFCLNVGCLLPLCPQCISQHQAYHFETSTQMSIVKLEQSIEAAQIELSSILTPLVKFRAEFHQIRAKKLQMFYENIQLQKKILLSKIQEEFNFKASQYVESIEQNLITAREKLQLTISQIQKASIGLMSGSRTIQTLVEFWINRRSTTQKVKSIQRDINLQSNCSSLDVSIIKNIEMQTDKVFKNMKNVLSQVPATVPDYSFHTPEVLAPVQEDKMSNLIFSLQQQNKRILQQLGRSRFSY